MHVQLCSFHLRLQRANHHFIGRRAHALVLPLFTGRDGKDLFMWLDFCERLLSPSSVLISPRYRALNPSSAFSFCYFGGVAF